MKSRPEKNKERERKNEGGKESAREGWGEE